MFHDAVFRFKYMEFTLPIRVWELSRVERDYGWTFVRWVNPEIGGGEFK